MTADIIVFAHRGASGYEFENTFKAFDKAVELGCNGLETDCWLLADGSVAVHHNKFIPIAKKFSKNITKLTKDTLSSIRLPNGESIPLIQDLFSKYEHTKDLNRNLIKFSIDLQDPIVGAALAGIIDDFDMTDRVFLCSEDLKVIQKIRKSHPYINLVASNIRKMVQQSEFPHLLDITSLNLHAINLQGKNMTEALSVKIHSHGFKLFIWDLHTAESVYMGLKYHPDAIYTDFPDVARKIIDELAISNNIINEGI